MSEWTLIGKFLTGNATEAERLEVAEKLVNDPAFRADYEKSSVIWGALAMETPEIPDPGSEFLAFKKQVTMVNRAGQRERLSRRITRGAVAASVLLCGFFLGRLTESDSGTPVSGAVTETVVTPYFERTEHLQEKKRDIKVFTTSNKKVVYLPDSTVAELSPGSILTYGEDFGQENRKVRLNGEGFFRVKRDTTCAFVIDSEKVSTEVLGTSFSLRAYDLEDSASIKVEEGLVRFHIIEPDSSYLLKASEGMTVNRKTGAKRMVFMTVNKKNEPLFVKNRRDNRKNIINLLSLWDTDWKRGIQLGITGKIRNTSDQYTIGRIKLKLRITRIHKLNRKEQTLIKTETLDQEIRPGVAIDFVLKVDKGALFETKSVEVQIEDADIVSGYDR